MAKWTDGPWKYEQGADERDFIVTEPTGNTICEPNGPLFADYAGLDDSIRKIMLDEAQANAKLIAKAPELAELLRRLVACEDFSDVKYIARDAEKLLSEIGAGD